MEDSNEPTSGYKIGVPLQNTEDHLARLLGRQSEESIDSTELTSRDERDLAIDNDDESLLSEAEVENAQDDVIDADDDDSMRSNNLTPVELSDSTRLSDLFDTENESRKREGHVISPEDRN